MNNMEELIKSIVDTKSTTELIEIQKQMKILEEKIKTSLLEIKNILNNKKIIFNFIWE